MPPPSGTTWPPRAGFHGAYSGGRLLPVLFAVKPITSPSVREINRNTIYGLHIQIQKQLQVVFLSAGPTDKKPDAPIMSMRDTLNRPIAEAAVSTTYFERARVHHTQAEFKFHDPSGAVSSGASFCPVGVTTTVRNYTIQNAVLDADTGLLVQDGMVIPETSYFVPKGADLTREHPSLVRLDDNEDLIIGYNNAHGGYLLHY